MTTQQYKPEYKGFGLANILVILGLGILLAGAGYSAFKLHELSTQRKQIKEDYATINNITFGIFSVDQWREKISDVVNSQVQDFHLTAAQKKQIQAQVEQALNGLVDKTIATFTKPQTSISGKLKNFAFKKFVDPKEIRAQVPSFARVIVNKVASPASTKRLKGIAMGKLTQLEDQTYDSTFAADSSMTSDLYKRYHVADEDHFNKVINTQLAAILKLSYQYLAIMFGCVVAVLLVWVLLRKRADLYSTLFVMSLCFAFVLIYVGSTTSIIEVDARLKTLNFMLMGQKVSFDNQVLFFQSKSIMGIVDVLIRQPKPDAVVVGSLILAFIIVFPVLRLIFTGIHIMARQSIAENKIVKYFAFESGKWAMADVMVVGVLMTYIGLNGILKSQLSNLDIHNSFLTTITENITSLQPGYFVFVVFVLFSVVLTAILKRITPYDVK